MNRTLRFAMFLTVFLSIYGLMNFYVCARMASLFQIKRDAYFYLVWALCTVSYLGAHMLHSALGNAATRLIYVVCSSWMGIVFLLLSCLVVYEGIRLVIPVSPCRAGWCILVLTGLVSVYAFINAAFVTIKHVTVKTAAVTREITIVHLTDLHIGSIHRKRFLSRIVKKVNDLQPDIVCITGDLIDGPQRYDKDVLAPLNEIAAPVFYSMGNHERYFGFEKLEPLVAQTTMRLLRNEKIMHEGIALIGIDDTEDVKTVEKYLGELDIREEEFTLLMYHRPVRLKTVHDAGVDLMLAGHVHAGQIFPFNLIIRFFYPFDRGLHAYRGMFEYVSPGTGTWGPPMRLGSRNEITLIRVQPLNEKGVKSPVVKFANF